MAKKTADPVIKKALAVFQKSGKSLEEVGCAMGYPEGKARQSVWQLLNKVDDPRVSSLRRLAKALGIAVKDLF
jgi:transcriptional regulator with XRE-family HTH domain